VNDRIADIHSRAADISQRGANVFPQLREHVAQIAQSSKLSRSYKYFRLTEIADEAMKVVAPSTPCRKGCSACCRIALPISLTQAADLAVLTGRKLSVPVRSAITLSNQIDRDVKRFKGVPCPFLADNECSIYEHRPMQCRVHHVIESDASRCEPLGDAQDIASYDLEWVSRPAIALGMGEFHADVREFFK
jgi:Fe-S-cluster containining protein